MVMVGVPEADMLEVMLALMLVGLAIMLEDDIMLGDDIIEEDIIEEDIMLEDAEALALDELP